MKFSKRCGRAAKTASFVLCSVLFLFTLLLGSMQPIINYVKNHPIAVGAADDSDYAELNDNYSAFADGATYSYTDGTIVSEFVDQADGIGTDRTVVSIDRSHAHGTKRNPYVIDSYDKWITFAQENGYVHDSDPSYQYGYGKVWVLAVDIDFRNRAFLPVWAFGGEFYGLGHTLSNITYNYADLVGNRWANEELGMGVFCYTYTGNVFMPNPVVIADLNVDNYIFTNCSTYAGAITGRIAAHITWILNCHAKGTLDRSTACNKFVYWGGITSGPLNIFAPNVVGWGEYIASAYRCSADTKMNINEPSCDTDWYIGGIMGGAWVGCTSYVYDCYAKLTVNQNGSTGTFIGGIVGVLPSNNWNGTGGTHVIRECVANVIINFINWAPAGVFCANGAIFAIQAAGDPDGDRGGVYRPSAVNISCANSYGSTTINYTKSGGIFGSYLAAGTKISRFFPIWSGRADGRDNQSAWKDRYATINLSNCYYSGNNSYAIASAITATDGGNFFVGTGSTYTASESGMYNLAKNSDALKTKIWEQKTSIGGTYGIANSPVKNTKITPEYTVGYYNLKMNGSEIIDEPLSGVASRTYTYGSMTTLSLAGVNDMEGRQFRGWTLDRTGNTEPVRSMSMTGMNGDLKFYAVWDITDSSATLSTVNNITEAEYGGTPIYLRANLITPSVSDPVVEFRWLKDGEVVSTATGMENNEYVLDSVGQSGEYSLEYTLSDKNYPLMRYEGAGQNALDLTITGKSTKLKRFTISSETPAYAGMTLENVKFVLVMTEENSTREVPGTARWEYTTGVVQPGSNTFNVIFTPEDLGNYKVMTVPVTFEAGSLKLTFNMDQVSTYFEVPLNYKGSYSATDIVKLFQDAFVAKIESDYSFETAVQRRTPRFNGMTAGDFNLTYENVTEDKTVEVTFVETFYTVILNPNNGEVSATLRDRYWGERLATPEYAYDGFILTGWYYTDASGQKRAWDFENDVVTSDLELSAEWKALNMKLKSLTATPALGAYTALSALKNGDLLVEALYDSDEGEIKRILNLKSADVTDGYTLAYALGDGQLHVSTRTSGGADPVAGNIVTVTYEYKGTIRRVNVTLNVQAKRADTSELEFRDKVAEETKNAIEIDRIPQSSLPTGITSVEYIYTNTKTQVVGPAIEIGEYRVEARFITSSDDYVADSRFATLVIKMQLIAVKVTWSAENSFDYTGYDQHPVATVTVAETGEQIGEAYYSYLGAKNETEFINAGSYNVSVVLNPNGDYKFAAGTTTSMRFTINKLSKNKPTLLTGVDAYVYAPDTLFRFEYRLDGYDPEFMEFEGVYETTNAGNFTARVALIDNVNYYWTGTSQTTASQPISFSWSVAKLSVPKPTLRQGISYEFNESEYSFSELLDGFDEYTMTLTGTTSSVNAGNFTARVALSDTVNYYWEGTLASGTAQPINFSWSIAKKAIAAPVVIEGSELVYTGYEQELLSVLDGFDELLMSFGGTYTAMKAGSYRATVSLKNRTNYYWSGTSATTNAQPVNISWTIAKLKVAAPTLAGETSFVYDGSEHAIVDSLSGFDAGFMAMEGDHTKTNACTTSTGYRATVKLTDTVNYEWEDGKTPSFNWSISKATVAKPTFGETISYPYNGETQTVKSALSGFDEATMTLGGTFESKNVSTSVSGFSARIQLKDKNNYVWADNNSNTDVSVNWSITKIDLTVEWEDVDTFETTDTTRTPKVVGLSGLAATDSYVTSDFVYGGDVNKTTVGGYIVKVTVKSGWASNYNILNASKGYRIIPAGASLDDPTLPQIPDVPLDPPTEPGGNTPGGNTPGGNPPGGTTGDKPTDSFLPENLPLWQLVVTGIGVILIIVFLSRTLSLSGKMKRAKKLATTTYSFAGAALLAAAPWLGVPQIGWTAIAFATLGIALVLLVVMLVVGHKCAVAVNAAEDAEKRRAAEEKREQEEERRRRDDDFKMMMASMMNRPMPDAAPAFDVQALLTGMQESMGNMITALLPATAGANAGENETVKLLLAQNSEMMEKLNNQPAVDGSASDERMRALEERMAEQQRLAEERAAEQQRIADERLAQQQAMMLEQQRMAEERAAEQQRLTEERIQAERADAQRREEDARKMQQEMMARQEELIKKMLEREAAPVVVQQEGSGGSNTTNSFVYEVEEEKLSIDRLTLAEAYEAMNDNAKKLFDDLVAYVTSKPETVESDGKYAISFKYRAKALFKLVIKRGIPTMNYSTEGEQLRQIKRDAAASEGLKVRFKLSELQVMDSSTFDVAKEVIKVCMEQIDKDIEFLKEQKAAKRRKPKE